MKNDLFVNDNNQKHLAIGAVKYYNDIPLPQLQVKLFKNGLITSTNHLFIKTRYQPTGIFTPFDDKKLSFKKRWLLYIKSNFVTRNNKFEGTFLWAYDVLSNNYYHWLYEVLPRLLMMSAQYPEAKIILPNYLREVDFVQSSLDILKFDTLWINNNETNRFENLVLVLTTPPIGNVLNQHIVRNVQRKIFEGFNINLGQATGKVYISRAKAKYRKIKNEEKILGLIKESGYQILYTEDLSFIEQINIFSSTNTLISLHGAGLSNMMFMPQKSKVLEIRNPDWDAQPLCYFGVANALNINWDFILTDPNPDATNFQDVVIDVENFTEKLLEFESNNNITYKR